MLQVLLESNLDFRIFKIFDFHWHIHKSSLLRSITRSDCAEFTQILSNWLGSVFWLPFSKLRVEPCVLLQTHLLQIPIRQPCVGLRPSCSRLTKMDWPLGIAITLLDWVNVTFT